METFEEKLAALDRPLTVGELAGILGVAPYTIRDWIKQRRLPAYRIGNSWRFEPREIADWWRARRVGR